MLAASLNSCAQTGQPQRSAASANNPLKIPEGGVIPVAFALSDGATMIDFAGPWEVFQERHGGGGRTNAAAVQTLHRVRKDRADSNLRRDEGGARVHL